MSDLKEAAHLLRMARKDVQAMRALASPETVDIETFGFHAQQAVEKAFKAQLAYQGVLYPRIHDLDRLLDLLREHGVSVPATFDGLSALTDFGVAFRYETYDESDEPFDRGQIIQQVERLLHHVTELLSPEEKG